MDFGAFILLERHLDGIKNDGASIGGSMDDEGKLGSKTDSGIIFKSRFGRDGIKDEPTFGFDGMGRDGINWDKLEMGEEIGEID